jgi:uncharacterized protein
MTRSENVLTRPLIGFLRSQFCLDWYGIHGAKHWARVRANGLLLAEHTGAEHRIVELFAFLHDSCRRNENHDPEHGLRAAELTLKLQGRFFDLPANNLDQLVAACAGHTHESRHADITIATCWDADRLDLGRVGIEPDPARLCTEAACRFLKCCVERTEN